MGGRPAIIYHMLGLTCPEKPADLMGTNHGVTQFPEMLTCNHCKVSWDEESEAGRMPELDENGGLKIPAAEFIRVRKS